MTNIIKRSITGFLFIALVIGAIGFGKESFFILSLLIITLCLIEFYNLAKQLRVRPQKLTGILTGTLLFASNYFYANNCLDGIVFVPFIPIFFSMFIIELYRNHKFPFSNIAYTVLGVLYIALPFSLANHIVFRHTFPVSYKPEILLGVFLLVWAYDTGSYITGVPFGKNKLFYRISPKKSWEGTIGGALITIFVAFIMAGYFQQIKLFDWMVIAVIVLIMGTYGDLAESLFKRSIQVKDSGNLLPGHGGVLDRFDGVLFTLPIVYIYIVFVMDVLR